MTKEVKIPMFVGIILYGIALLIDLIGVLIPDLAYVTMGATYLKDHFNGFIFPSVTIFQIIGIIMLITFYMVMQKYNGPEKRIVGIIMIVIFCVINVVQPYIRIAETQAYASFSGEKGLSALTTLESFIAMFTQPFTLVSTVFVMIAIGRYGIIKRENNNNSDI
jgi:hypothetical protein